jgi:FdhE protein
MEKNKDCADNHCMTLSPASPLLSPEEIAVRAGQQIPYLQLPARASVFAEREMRLRQRAAAHPMRDFLLFTAELAHVQHELLQSYPEVALPDAEALHAAAHAAQAPLPAAGWPRDGAWRSGFRNMLERLLPRLANSPAQAVVRALSQLSDAELEYQADCLLQNGQPDLDLAGAPLIAAALQMYWTHMVLTLQEARGTARDAPFGRTLDVTRCPCCASLPTASVARVDGSGGHYRYLHCSLCSAQWHMVRIKCSHCESTKGIHYQSLQPVTANRADSSAGGSPHEKENQPAVEAETCDECRHYLKIVRMERDISVEPVADDLASLTLDLLVSEAGFQRHGVNLMLLFGAPDSEGGAR